MQLHNRSKQRSKKEIINAKIIIINNHHYETMSQTGNFNFSLKTKKNKQNFNNKENCNKVLNK